MPAAELEPDALLRADYTAYFEITRGGTGGAGLCIEIDRVGEESWEEGEDTFMPRKRSKARGQHQEALAPALSDRKRLEWWRRSAVGVERQRLRTQWATPLPREGRGAVDEDVDELAYFDDATQSDGSRSSSEWEKRMASMCCISHLCLLLLFAVFTEVKVGEVLWMRAAEHVTAWREWVCGVVTAFFRLTMVWLIDTRRGGDNG